MSRWSLVSSACCSLMVALLRLQWCMERKVRVRVAFQPTHQSAELLRHAYERLVPIARRSIQQASAGQDAERVPAGDPAKIKEATR